MGSQIQNAEASPQALILASASPRRADLLRKDGIPFQVRVPKVREKTGKQAPHLTPRKLAIHNAELKAQAAARMFPQRWVLGADTLVVLGNALFGKPRDMAEAERMLQALSGRTHRVITGVCLRRNGTRRSFAVTTRVTLKLWTPVQIRKYLQKIQPLDKAGAYAAQYRANRILQLVKGSLSNVVGLPMERLRVEWKRANRPSAS